MNCSMLGLPVHHQLPESTQTHVHWVSDAIQPSHPLSSPSPLPSIFPSIRVFSSESALHIRWPKYWSFNFNISPSNEHPGLISLRMDCKEIQPVHPKAHQSWRKDWCWSWNSNILATWCKELTYWKRLWCWKRLKAGGKADDRGWGGWMASLTQWTWVWVNSKSWWWTGRPSMLQFMGWQRVWHDWTTEVNWFACLWKKSCLFCINSL